MFESKESSHPALVEWITYRLDSWRNHRNMNYRAKWNEYYRLWRGVWAAEDSTRATEKSRLISPTLQQAVESSVAELEEATFGRGKWFDIKDDLLDQDKTEADKIRNLLQEDLEKNGVKDSICEVFLNAAIYGTGVGKIIIDQNIEKVPAAQGEGYGGSSYTAIPSLDVRVEAISPHDFIIDPASLTINDGLGVAHEVIKSRYHIVAGIKAGIYNDVPLDGDYNVENLLGETHKQADESDNVKITEYWGKVPKRYLKKGKGKATKDDFEYKKNDDMVEAVVTIVNDTYILKAEVNAFMMEDRPFISYQHDIVPNQFWGRGVCEKGYNAQKALDAEMRARIDSLALTTTPMMAADATRLPRGIKFEVRAGRTILTNGPPRDALMPLNIGVTDPNTINQIALLQGMVQAGTGSTDVAAGNDRTASGMSMTQSASIKRQKRTLMNFQNTFLIPLINKSMWRKIQFDVNRYPVSDYKFVPYSTMGIMAKELEMSQMVQMLQTIPKDSPAFGVILVALFENSSIHNRDEIVAGIAQGLQPNPQQQQMQQQAMALNLQQLEANVHKTMSEAQEEQAKAVKWQAEAQQSVPTELDMQSKMMDMQKKAVDIAKTEADVKRQNSETARNAPEVDHLKSETALNMANARAKDKETGTSPMVDSVSPEEQVVMQHDAARDAVLGQLKQPTGAV